MANLTGSRSVFPNQLDSFRELVDISPSKKVQAKRYQELKMKEVLSPAEVSELNSLMTELQDFIVTPEYTNKMLDALINLESFFLTETVGFVNTKQTEMNSYVDTKKTEMQTEINKFSYKGAYSPSTSYLKNNFVDFNDGSSNQTYLCIENCIDKEPSSNPLFWRKLTIQGVKGDRGDAGANFVYKGSWDSVTTYMKDEAVTYGGNLFVSKIDSNTGFEPSISGDTTQWFKAMDISIVSKDMIGTRVLSSQSNYVNFITDEITTFNASLDSLSVYMNSVRLTKGVDYTINPNNQVINKINGTWDGTSENPIFFEFVVRKNVNNDIVFKDGTTLQNGSVTRNKLDIDTQTEINKINTIVNNVGSGTLETSSQEIIPAINELHTELDLKVNTVDINDILTPQGILDKVKQVDGTGSGLDADLLDGKHATDFALSAHTHAIATQSEVDAGTSNTLYVTPLGLAGLKQSVVNGKQQIVNAINDSLGYSSGLTINNTHADYAWWITNKVSLNVANLITIDADITSPSSSNIWANFYVDITIGSKKILMVKPSDLSNFTPFTDGITIINDFKSFRFDKISPTVLRITSLTNTNSRAFYFKLLLLDQ